jgi:hypothetical protein
MSAELTKVDSAVAGLSIKDEKEKKSRRGSAEGVYNIKELGKLMLQLIRCRVCVDGMTTWDESIESG